MLALNQNRSSLQALKRRVQGLNDHYHHVSQDLEHLKQSTTQEIEDLRSEQPGVNVLFSETGRAALRSNISFEL